METLNLLKFELIDLSELVPITDGKNDASKPRKKDNGCAKLGGNCQPGCGCGSFAGNCGLPKS